jgi:predicted PurR-regulated permease PerM
MEDKEKSYFAFKENRKLKILFFVLFSVIVILLVYIYRYYFWPFLFALVLYMALRPVCELITRIVRKRLISSIIIIVLLFMLVLIPMFFLLLSLANQAYDFYIFIQQRFDAGVFERFLMGSETLRKMYGYFNIGEAEILKNITEVLKKTSFTVFSNLTSLLSFSLKFSLNFFFMLLILFFLFKDGYKLEKSFYRVLPFPDDIEKDVVSRLMEVIKVLLAGNLLIMLLQGLMLGLGFYIFGVGMPLLWGSIAAILSLIPVIGTAFVWLPAVIYLAAIGSYLSALFLGIWCLFFYLLLENFVKPNVFGKRLNFHPLIFFFLLLGSIQTFGLTGVIVGPILLTLFFSFWEIYKLLDDYNASSE